MKKLLGLCAVFLCAHQLSNAQTQKGNQAIGLNVGVNRISYSSSVNTYYSNQDGKVTYFKGGPDYGYFIADGLELGAAFSFGKSTLSNNNYSDAASFSQHMDLRQNTASIYLGKYFLNDKKFGFRALPHLDYSWGSASNISEPNPTYNYTARSRAYSAGVNFDMVYFPSKKIGLAANLAGLTYAHIKEHDEAATYQATTNDLKLKLINSQLSFTIFYMLGSNN